MILGRCHLKYKHADPSGGRFNVVARQVLQQCKRKREIFVNCAGASARRSMGRVSAAAAGLSFPSFDDLR
jgi:hypothetical protein